MFHKSLFQCIKSSSNDDHSIIENNYGTFRFNSEHQTNLAEAEKSYASINSTILSQQTTANNMSTSTKANCSMNTTVSSAKSLRRTWTSIKNKLDAESRSILRSSILRRRGKSSVKRCKKTKSNVLSSTLASLKSTAAKRTAEISLTNISKVSYFNEHYFSDDDDDEDDDDDDDSFNGSYVNVSRVLEMTNRHYYEDPMNSSLSSVSDEDDEDDEEINYERFRSYKPNNASRFNPLISSSKCSIFETSRRRLSFVPNTTSSRKSLIIGNECQACMETSSTSTTFRSDNICSSTLIESTRNFSSRSSLHSSSSSSSLASTLSGSDSSSLSINQTCFQVEL